MPEHHGQVAVDAGARGHARLAADDHDLLSHAGGGTEIETAQDDHDLFRDGAVDPGVTHQDDHFTKRLAFCLRQ